MKRITLLLICFLLPLICLPVEEGSYVDKFILDIQKQMALYDQHADLAQYMKKSNAVSDAFICELFSREIKKNDVFDAINKFKDDKLAPHSRVDIEPSKKDNEIRIGLSFITHVEQAKIEESLTIYIYPIPQMSRITYFIYYDQDKRIDIGPIDSDRGPDIRGLSTFRIMQYNPQKAKYEIVARFEDTNMYNYRGGSTFTSPNGVTVSPKQMSGDLCRSTFSKRADGSMAFLTCGGILPEAKGIIPGQGANHWKSYRVNWVLTPKNYLYAEEIHWNIKKIEDEYGHLIREEATIIKLKH
jgi:hypothetical protein